VQSPSADLDRPVALVTDGAGGTGTALCRALAARGHRVVVADLDLAAARLVADAVDGSAVAVDVGDWAANRAMVDHALPGVRGHPHAERQHPGGADRAGLSAMVAGRAPVRYDFPPVPTTLRADGRAATLS
jgi:NAD(P)-dependent dehydrogenase (short-subunit alcohol dehydrogenase family)